MTEQAQPVPYGLKLARNAIAAIGGVMLLLGLLLHAGDGPAAIPIWLGMVCLVVAAGIALATTRWRTLPIGTRIVVMVALGGLALVVIDLI